MIKIYNTLARKKQVFRPRKKKKINLFVCGPTTYDFSHIGHARTYVVFDMITKYLKQKGYYVKYIQNITDIDDKILARAEKEKVDWKKLSRKFEKEYLKDMDALNVNNVDKYARATDHIKEIISQVKRLLKKGYAYKIEDGIYYDISKFKNYGELSGRTVVQAEDAVSKIDENKNKKNKGDFCLWKGDFAEGRPGWHIEDTAITEKYFGPQYDIHGGAKDLIFPHHEAEISQMEAISGKKPLVKYWLHTGFLTVKGKKMSKSLGNFITIRNFLEQRSLRILRLFILKNHYRSPIDYNEKEIKQVEKQLQRIDEFIDKLKIQSLKLKTTTENSKLIKEIKKNFKQAMEDDFNTPKALASIFELINTGNFLLAKNQLSKKNTREILKFLKQTDKFFAFIFKKKESIPLKVQELVKQREKYRKEKNWPKSDQIRKQIEKTGYKIEDTSRGPKIRS